MVSTHVSLKKIFIAALFLSFLIHFAFVNFSKITFEDKFSPRTDFVFLGPILNDKNLLTGAYHQNNKGAVSVEIKDSSLRPYAITHLEKPQEDRQSEAAGKISLKILPGDKKEALESEQDGNIDLGILDNSNIYQPLALP